MSDISEEILKQHCPTHSPYDSVSTRNNRIVKILLNNSILNEIDQEYIRATEDWNLELADNLDVWYTYRIVFELT